MKKCSTFVSREMQIKTIMRYHLRDMKLTIEKNELSTPSILIIVIKYIKITCKATMKCIKIEWISRLMGKLWKGR